MEKFVKFMSKIHLNGINIGLYSNKEGVIAKAENVTNGKKLGTRSFKSIEDAEKWFESMKGNEAGKLANAIDNIAGE